MSGSSSSGVTRVEPPSYQLPYLQSGLGAAQGLYDRGPIQPYTGNTVAAFAPQQEQAFNMIENRATNGDPTLQAANSYVQNSLNGGFMGSNPYLDQTFNRAALQTQGQLASEFARGGRNIQASQGLRSQQLNDLAGQIYGGQYNNDRQLQQGALAYAQPLGNQAYTDAAQLGGVGGQVQGLANQIGQQRANIYNQQQAAPGQALDQYLARVRGQDYGSTQSTTQKNPGNLLGTLLGGGLGLLGLLG
jgi:hypothetical protein